MSDLQRELRLSVQIAQCSPELRRYVHEMKLENERLRRELGMRRLMDDLRTDQINLDASRSEL